MASTNSYVAIDEDPVADKLLAYLERVVGASTVQVGGLALSDGDNHNIMAVRTDKRAETNARPDSGATIVTSTPTMSATTTINVVTANTARRGLWITNNHATIQVWAGDSAVVTNRGIPIPPKSTMFIDRCPAASWYVKPEADLGSNVIAILEERD